VTNALAYYSKEFNTTIKSLMTQALVIKTVWLLLQTVQLSVVCDLFYGQQVGRHCGGIQTLDLMVMNRVFYHCANTTGQIIM
jgi:hypothetical protein